LHSRRRAARFGDEVDMNLSERKSTPSIKIAKVWFVFVLLVAVFQIFQDGIGWNLVDAVIPSLALLILAYRYPWGRILTVVLLSMNLALLFLKAIPFIWLILKSLYRSLSVDQNIVGLSPPEYLMKTFVIFLLLGVMALFLWLIIDLLRNEKTRKYFVSKEELLLEKST
jgi:hypothetical protein